MSAARTIHIVDDNAGIRRSLERLLRAAGFEVAIYDDAVTFLEAAFMLEAGCILVDAQMPEIDVLEIQARLKHLRVGLPLIVISDQGDVPMAVRAMKAGAADFIAKPLDGDHLLTAIEAALARSKHSGRQSDIAEAVERIAALSPREREVLDALTAGRPNKTIARDLGISVRTVEVHRARMLERLGTHHLAVAVRLAVMAALGAD